MNLLHKSFSFTPSLQVDPSHIDLLEPSTKHLLSTGHGNATAARLATLGRSLLGGSNSGLLVGGEVEGDEEEEVGGEDGDTGAGGGAAAVALFLLGEGGVLAADEDLVGEAVDKACAILC